MGVRAREVMKTSGAISARARPRTSAQLFLVASSIALTSCPSETGSTALSSHFEPAQELSRSAAKLVARQLLEPSERSGAETARVQPEPVASASSDPAPEVSGALEPEEVPAPEDVERVLVSIGRETWIYAEPRL